jgi:hypothetical protein
MEVLVMLEAWKTSFEVHLSQIVVENGHAPVATLVGILDAHKAHQ